MKSYTVLNLIVFFFFLEIIIYSSAKDWKNLKKKLIALSILNGLRAKKSYVLPYPLPLPMPVLIKKSSAPIVLPPEKYRVLVPKPMPVYHFVPKFVPIDEKPNLMKNANAVNDHERSYQVFNDVWNQDWSQDTYSDNTHVNQELLSLANDGHQEVVMPSFSHGFNYGLPLDDGQQDYHEQSLSQHSIPEEDTKKRKNVHKFEKQDFKSFREIGFNNEDLLMTSSESKAKQNVGKTSDRHRKSTANRSVIRLPVNNKPKEGLPVNSNRIKLLTDLKTNGQFSTTEPPIKTGVARVRIGEIRLRPQQLRSLLSNSNVSFE